MKKTLQIITKIILIMFAILLTIILLDALIFYTPICYTFNPILLVFGVVIYLLLIVFLYKKLVPKIENNKYIAYILMAIFCLLCFVISYLTRLNPTWDMGSIYNMVVNNITKGVPYTNFYYLYAYPHNLMIVAIWNICLKIIHSLNIGIDYITALTMINSIIVSLTVLLMYKIATKMGGKRKGILILFIAIFTSPLYLHAAIYYTDAISALFATLLVYMYLIMRKQEDFKIKIAYQILFGIVLLIRN